VSFFVNFVERAERRVGRHWATRKCRKLVPLFREARRKRTLVLAGKEMWLLTKDVLPLSSRTARLFLPRWWAWSSRTSQSKTCWVLRPSLGAGKLAAKREYYTAWRRHAVVHTVSQAYFALHKTLHEVQNFQEKNIFWY
jgi:hypothetical protein